jgi:hypothetical protein
LQKGSPFGESYIDFEKKNGKESENKIYVMKFRIVFWDVLSCKIIIPDYGGSTYL